MPFSKLVAYCVCTCLATIVCAGFQLKRYSYLCEYRAHGGLQCLPRPFHIAISLLTFVLALFGVVAELKLRLCGLERCISIWGRLLTRVWGRSLFYAILAVMELSHGTIYGHLAGGVLFLAAVLSLAVSFTATRKLHRLRSCLLDEWKDTDKERIRVAFDKYDTNQSGALDPSELSRVVADLGQAMTPEEFSSMLGMLDCDALGRVHYESFASYWLGEAGYTAA